MNTIKDYLKIIFTIFATGLITYFLTGISNESNASQRDLIEMKSESFRYTDDAILKHQQTQEAQFETLTTSINAVNENTKANNVLIQKLIDLQLKR